MSSEQSLKIEPMPQYLGRHDDQYAFAYTIHITNKGVLAVTLKDRHWIITHGDGTTEEVVGEGVVGETPELPPGSRFTYTSGAFLPTRSGSMRGTYGFEAEDGESFRVEIPEFALISPDALH